MSEQVPEHTAESEGLPKHLAEQVADSDGGRRAGSIARVDSVRAAVSRRQDAERYVCLALELGATEAEVIAASTVVVDDRVVLKCAVPTCFGYNTCANCPPHAPSPDRVRSTVAHYETAVALRLEVAPEVLVRDRATIKERVGAYQQMFSLVSALESAAFYDGHYLSVGFAAGSCKSTFCYDIDCAVLQREKCRHSLVARPSMEAVGIDCYALAEALGWAIYPVGSSACAGSVPAGSLLGVVFVG